MSPGPGKKLFKEHREFQLTLLSFQVDTPEAEALQTGKLSQSAGHKPMSIEITCRGELQVSVEFELGKEYCAAR